MKSKAAVFFQVFITWTLNRNIEGNVLFLQRERSPSLLTSAAGFLWGRSIKKTAGSSIVVGGSRDNEASV